MNYIEYQFDIQPKEPFGEILTAFLADLEFESFVETDNGISAYVRTDLDDESGVQQIIDDLKDVNIRYTKKEIIQQNWNEEWESNFHPILVADQCYIRAEFHESKPEIPYEVIIQPKMAFGTGHHETTHLMVEYILETEFEGKDVLDMGCGTSILGILAKMKGANYVEAIDFDQWAVDNSIENAERNKVELNIKLGDSSSLDEKAFDIILANINKNVLMRDIPNYVKNLNFTEGELILSGLMTQDFDDIKSLCESLGLKFINKKQRNEWIALKFIKN